MNACDRWMQEKNIASPGHLEPLIRLAFAAGQAERESNFVVPDSARGLLTNAEYDALCDRQDAGLLKLIMPRYVAMRTALLYVRAWCVKAPAEAAIRCEQLAKEGLGE